MNQNISEMSLRDLEKLKKTIEKKIVKEEVKAKKQAVLELEKKAASLGFALTDLLGMIGNKAQENSPKPQTVKRTAVRQKYRNPEDPSQTWSGRGRKPLWVERGISSGGKLEDFVIK